MTQAQAGRLLEGVIAVLHRIVPFAATLRRGIVRLGLVALAAAVVLGYGLFRNGIPDASDESAARVIALLVVLAPPAILLVFSFALREVLEVPARVRRLPQASREHAAELGRIVDGLGEVRKGGIVRMPAQVLRMATFANSARELLTPYAPVLALLSVPFMLAAFVASLLEIALAVIVLITLAF